jgi:hypothetical protein
LRPIFFAPESYPRYAGKERNVSAYFPVGNQKEFEAIGHIPQVAHTYGYFEEVGPFSNHMIKMPAYVPELNGNAF